MQIAILLAGLAVGGALGFLTSWFLERKGITRARAEAKRILDEARSEAQELKKRAEAEAKAHWSAEKSRFERETRAKRRELEKAERNLEAQRREVERLQIQLGEQRKELTKRERLLRQRERALAAREEKIAEREREVASRLEQVAKMTQAEAKEALLRSVESQVRYEAAQMAYRIKEEAKLKAEREAKEIIATAIQRCAAAHTAETAVTVVPLPSDDIKGRIIGREGRNIRAFEAVTGVEVIIDDTPEAITLSSFDPIRREIARLTMEALIRDGRIHPARIEELYSRAQAEFEERVREIGNEVMLEMGISDMAPELVDIVGRMKFRTSYGQNLLQHSIEVANLAGIMAAELGLPVELARRAGLLHDIGKTMPGEMGPHALVGAQLARRYGESEVVVNAIAAHHEDTDPKSPIAVLVAAADAISGARPGARRESLEAYIKRIETLEEIASGYPGVEAAYAMQAGRELRVIVDAARVSDAEAMEMAREIAQKVEEAMEYPGQIKVVVIRETRAIEYAK